MTSAISSALSSYDDSSQVDSKIITALLDFYTRTRSRSRDCQCAGERGSVELLHPGRDAELRDRRAAGVLPSDRAGFPAHGHLPAVLDQLANPNRDRRRHRRRGLPHPSAGRHAAVSANGSFESLVRTNVTPPSSRAYTKAEADGRYLRVRRRAQGWARHHSESAPTRPIPAEGSPASDPTRPIPAEGSPASSRIRTAPQRERSDTPDPRRGFIGELKDSHGTTPIPAEGSPASDPTRPIPAEGSPASSRIRTAPQRERSDTPDPRRGFIGELKDSHGTTPIPAEGSPASDPTRPIPAEGSPASSRIRTAPQRERSDTPDPHKNSLASSRIRTAPHRSPQRVRRRAIRHARSPQRVRRRAQGFARHHSGSAPTRPIPVEGSSASSRIRTAPQRERSDTPDPCRRLIGVEGSSASSRIRTAPQRERSDTLGELKDSHGTTAGALRHARSL